MKWFLLLLRSIAMISHMSQGAIKMNKNDLLSGPEQTCLIFAARYAHTRNTGAACLVIAAILKNWGRLSELVQLQLKREAKNEATCNMEDWRRIIDR